MSLSFFLFSYFSSNQVPRPDGKADNLGLLVLDEPSTKQSDPTVLSLWLTENSKQHSITVRHYPCIRPQLERVRAGALLVFEQLTYCLSKGVILVSGQPDLLNNNFIKI